MTTAPPPRRLPSRVYRRRRAVALLVLLIAVILLVTLVSRLTSGGDDGTDGSTASDLPTIYPTGAPVASATPSAPAVVASPEAGTPECTAEQVSVIASTNATRYAIDAVPELSMALTNESESDCAIDAGTADQEFVIASGADVVWRSSDCQVDASELAVLLPAGGTLSGATLDWDRTRSAPETCSGGRESVGAEGSTYTLTVTVDGLASDPEAFILE